MDDETKTPTHDSVSRIARAIANLTLALKARDAAEDARYQRLEGMLLAALTFRRGGKRPTPESITIGHHGKRDGEDNISQRIRLISGVELGLNDERSRQLSRAVLRGLFWLMMVVASHVVAYFALWEKKQTPPVAPAVQLPVPQLRIDGAIPPPALPPGEHR